MKKSSNNKKQGFTIIEVLIVLAIAGVIMLVIFLAVPSLQRNSRNSQRRSDAAHLSGLVNEYAANHAGRLPVAVGGAANQLDLTDEEFAIIDPKPVTANIFCPSGCSAVGTASTFPANNTTLLVVEGWRCNTTDNTLEVATRAFAITFMVETGGTDQRSCI